MLFYPPAGLCPYPFALVLGLVSTRILDLFPFLVNSITRHENNTVRNINFQFSFGGKYNDIPADIPDYSGT
jgi:hypothetical protein